MTLHDLLTRTPPTEQNIKRAERLVRRGYLRSEVVRATGLSADEVNDIKQRIETEAAQGRCEKTGDLFNG